MTNEEVETMKIRIYNGLNMVAEKAEKIGKAESSWSLDELYKMADIEKDIAKTFHCLLESHVLLNEHSVKKY